MTSLVTVIVALACGQLFGQGIIVQHLGARNPLTEGFTLIYRAGSVGPVTNDLGRSSWSIDSEAGAVQYRQFLSAAERGLLAGADWVLSAQLRIVPGLVRGATLMAFSTGSQGFMVVIGVQPNGDPNIFTGSSLNPVLVLNGAGAGYHEYDLYYHAATGLSDLWVDGSIRVGGVRGTTPVAGPWSVLWGGGLEGAGSQANWNSVSLAIVPEPSALGLLCCGGLLMGTRRWSKGVT
jgi:hypothetical protein